MDRDSIPSLNPLIRQPAGHRSHLFRSLKVGACRPKSIPEKGGIRMKIGGGKKQPGDSGNSEALLGKRGDTTHAKN